MCALWGTEMKTSLWDFGDVCFVVFLQSKKKYHFSQLLILKSLHSAVWSPKSMKCSQMLLLFHFCFFLHFSVVLWVPSPYHYTRCSPPSFIHITVWSLSVPACHWSHGVPIKAAGCMDSQQGWVVEAEESAFVICYKEWALCVGSFVNDTSLNRNRRTEIT